jgi:predicted transcriptional regulator
MSLRTRSWKSVKTGRLAPQALERAARRADEAIRELTLKELRQELALTQSEVADSAAMTQSELSRLESRADHRVSSLRRYVEALGGEIEITAIIGKRRVKLSDV